VSPTFKRNLFFALGLLAAVWFFVGYPSQDPRSLINLTNFDAETIEQKAKQKLESIGYNPDNFNTEIRFLSNRRLLDSLQQKMGRDKLVAQFQQKNFSNIVLFYWEVRFYTAGKKRGEIIVGGNQDESSDNRGPTEADIKIHFNQSGKFLELLNPKNAVHRETVNRRALASTFGTHADSAATLLSTYSDTALTNQLLIDLQRSWGQFNQSDTEQLERLKKAKDLKRPFRLSAHDVFKMASYYLQDTGWGTTELAQDTVYLGRVNGSNTVTAKFLASDPSLDQQLSLAVRLTSTGGLMSLESKYNPDQKSVRTNGGLWSVIQDMVLLIFCLGVVVLFFFRIRVRAIDTQPALVVSILAGLAVSLLAGLYLFQQAAFLNNGVDWTQNLQLLLGTGLSGAAASLGFFMLFSVADSITRQHWPQKLKVYDYLRQGMIFNKPVGFMLVRAVTLGFILSGLWTLLLWGMPQFFFDIKNAVFLSHQAIWPPLFVALSNGIYSFCFVLGIFLVIGSQVLAKTSSKIVTALVLVVACGVFVPFSGYFGPQLYKVIAGIVVGGAMLVIYMQWDFLTLLFSHFFFLSLIWTTTGWIVPGSLDSTIFILLLVLMAIFFGVGLAAIGRGTEEKMLPRYVPQYVEELAQEERIKQELQIAREVQQSFLPVRTPEFEDLELAAICKPAYETGGDYYDFVQLDDNRVAVMIGDVSGKGIQAAFYMTFVKGVIHSLCHEIDSPAEVLKKTNRLFCDNAPRGTFISLVYGIVDLDKKTFHFARAGHNPILRITSGNGSLEELQPNGIGIGLAKGESFEKHIEEVEIPLSGDDLLVLYTDGIVEALNEHQTFYGTKRLNNILKRNKKKSAKQILELLSQDVKTFVGKAEQHDDMTMLIMKLKKH